MHSRQTKAFAWNDILQLLRTRLDSSLFPAKRYRLQVESVKISIQDHELDAGHTEYELKYKQHAVLTGSYRLSLNRLDSPEDKSEARHVDVELTPSTGITSPLLYEYTIHEGGEVNLIKSSLMRLEIKSDGVYAVICCTVYLGNSKNDPIKKLIEVSFKIGELPSFDDLEHFHGNVYEELSAPLK